jgi:hypothetical protein
MDAGGSKLTALQRRILVLLDGTSAAWTLVGGEALVGLHLGHGTTRDLDLFFRPREGLGNVGREVR